MDNADIPAMPVVDDCGRPAMYGTDGVEALGLTKREMMAMHAMQGQLASLCTDDAVSWFTDAMRERGIDLGYPEKLIAINAVNYADALVAELERTK